MSGKGGPYGKKILQLKRAKYLINSQLAERSTNTDMFNYFVEEI